MKNYKIAIAVAVLMAAATAAKAQVGVDFDGSAPKAASVSGLSAFAQLASKAQELPEAEVVGIPMRVFAVTEQAALDKTIAGAMLSAQKRGYTELAAGFGCLLKSGTQQQKEEFVNWDAALPYTLPASCAPAANPQGEKGILNWVCRTVTEIIIRNVCKPNADGEMECMDQPVTALREACKWE